MKTHYETFQEEKFYYSKIAAGIAIATGAFMLVVAVGCFFEKGYTWIIGIVCGGLGIYTLIKYWKRFNNDTPQLVVSPEGIWMNNTGLHAWKKIKKTKVIEEHGDNGRHDILIYYWGNITDVADVTFSIAELNDFRQNRAIIKSL